MRYFYMGMSIRLRRIGLVFLLAGCGSESSPMQTCSPPPYTEYTCQPILTGSSGCIGGPMWSPYTGNPSLDAAVRQDDADKTFPGGCLATIPDCSGARARRFMCSAGATPIWVELL